MAEGPSDPNFELSKTADFRRMPKDEEEERVGNGKSSSPCRTTLEKILVVVVLSLLVLCIALIVLLTVRKAKPAETGPGKGKQSAKELVCAFSDEAKRVGFPDFLKRVQTTYYEYHRDELKAGIRSPKESVAYFKKSFLPFNVTPEYLKEKTDAARFLYDEINKKNIDENKMKPREVKAVQQIKLFLRTTFGSPYDLNFYDGDWLLGPNNYCWQRLCQMHYGLNRYSSVKPDNLSELVEVLRRIKLHGKSIRQYMSNMKLGVKTGMVRSRVSCTAGLNALKQNYKFIPKHNNPKDILKEWFVKFFRNESFFQGISKADRDSWSKSRGMNISSSIDLALIEGVGEPIVEMINYLEREHVRYCLPEGVADGLANLPVDYIYYDGSRTANRTTKILPITGQELNGKNSYKNILPYFTTSDITPEEINKIGQEALETLYPKAIEIAKNVTGESDEATALREFKKKLNSSDQFFNAEPFPANESDSAAHKDCSDVESAKANCPKRWSAVQKWFDYARLSLGMLAPKITPLFFHTGKKITVPNCPLEMKADFNPSVAAQSFVRSGSSCVGPAHYNIPFFLDNYGPKFGEWNVAAHEGWPGHHTQIQGQQEYFLSNCDDVLSWLDESTSYTFFSEGWALYAENPLIAKDTDTYDGHPLEEYGMLQWQIWRALRLIVDTGLHYRGMNRSTALGLFARYAWDETDVAFKEITRYQGYPGQATAYLLGRQKIVQLREYSKNELGDKFNIKEFHYHVLSQGAAPEKYLDKHIKKYVNCTLGDLEEDVCAEIINPTRIERDSEQKFNDFQLGFIRGPNPSHRLFYK